MLWRYIQKIKLPLLSSIIIAFAIGYVAIQSSLMALTYFYLYLFITNITLIVIKKTNIISILLSIFACSGLHQETILFLSVLPMVNPLLFIASFLYSYEFLIRIHPGLGDKFSFIKFIFFPRNTYNQLSELLDTRRALNPTFYRDSIAPTQQDSNHNVRLLELSLLEQPNETSILRKRQQKCIAQLPQQLIQLSSPEYKYDPNNKADFQTQVYQYDMRALGASFNEYEEHSGYFKTLSEPQQEAVKNYLLKKAKLQEGTCPLSLESVYERTNKGVPQPNKFIILEKQYKIQTKNEETVYKNVPGKSDVFLKTYFDLLFNKHRDVDAEHPLDRDKLCDSEKHGSYETRYVYRTYNTINGHPLSLELSELIESLNELLKPNLQCSYGNILSQLPPSKNKSTLQPPNPLTSSFEHRSPSSNHMKDAGFDSAFALNRFR